MKKNLFILTLAFSLSAQSSARQTFMYAVKGADSLYMDIFAATTETDDNPCLIYVFGGGFRTGQRYQERFLPYYDFMNRNGITVAAIDYRLARKSQQFDGPVREEQFLVSLKNAVDIAVDDLYDATIFLVENAEKLNIDPTRIISSGSSAGAMTSLQAEYYIATGAPNAYKIPEGFNYAGILSFAGALTVVDSENMAMPSRTCPIGFFHGDADRTVPYGESKREGFTLYGAASLSDYMTARNMPHMLYTVEGGDHSVAAAPMLRNRDDILLFIKKLVLRSEEVIVKATEKRLDR